MRCLLGLLFKCLPSPLQSHFHSLPHRESAVCTGKAGQNEVAPNETRPNHTIHRQYRGVKLVKPYAGQLPPIVYFSLRLNRRFVTASLRSHQQQGGNTYTLYFQFPRTFWTTTFFFGILEARGDDLWNCHLFSVCTGIFQGSLREKFSRKGTPTSDR